MNLGGVMLNNLSYADDMCLIAPSVKGLRKLVHICEEYAIEHDIIYNATKSKCMYFKSNNKLNSIPPVILNGNKLDFVSQFSYLGHIITHDLKDDIDIANQRRALCGRSNFLLRKFYLCSAKVKIKLFNAFCNNIYGIQLWCNFNITSLRNINVCHNNAIRRLLGLPRFTSASLVFVENNVNNLSCMRRKFVYNFLCRLNESSNKLINVLIASDLRYSGIQATWRSLLYSSF